MSTEDYIREKAKSIDDSDFEKVLGNVGRILSKAKGPLEKFGDEVKLLISMAEDYWHGRYKHAPHWVICVVIFVLLYILMPFDLVPDAIPLGGLVDDAMVVAAAIAMLGEEIKKYQRWLDNPPDDEGAE